MFLNLGEVRVVSFIVFLNVSEAVRLPSRLAKHKAAMWCSPVVPCSWSQNAAAYQIFTNERHNAAYCSMHVTPLSENRAQERTQYRVGLRKCSLVCLFVGTNCRELTDVHEWKVLQPRRPASLYACQTALREMSP